MIARVNRKYEDKWICFTAWQRAQIESAAVHSLSHRWGISRTKTDTMKGSPCCAGLMRSCLHTSAQVWGGHQPTMVGASAKYGGGHQPIMGGSSTNYGGAISQVWGVINQLWGGISQVWGGHQPTIGGPSAKYGGYFPTSMYRKSKPENILATHTSCRL